MLTVFRRVRTNEFDEGNLTASNHNNWTCNNWNCALLNFHEKYREHGIHTCLAEFAELRTRKLAPNRTEFHSIHLLNINKIVGHHSRTLDLPPVGPVSPPSISTFVIPQRICLAVCLPPVHPSCPYLPSRCPGSIILRIKSISHLSGDQT